MPVYVLPLFGFDVCSYSRRSPADQADVLRLINTVHDRAQRDLDGQILEQRWFDRGDGGISALLGHVELAAEFLGRFAAHLKSENRTRRSEAIVEARFALHLGTIRVEQQRIAPAVSGDGLNDVARMLEIMPHDRPGQVVISDAYFQILVEEAGTDRDLFQEIEPITDRHGKTHKLWNYWTDDCGVDISKD